MEKNQSPEDLLLELVIEYYVKYGAPIGSKFLFNSKEIDIAPSTIRKYLNNLEKKGLVYQPYNSAGRLPTVEGVNTYLSNILSVDGTYKSKDITRINRSFNLRGFIEVLGEFVDGVSFGHYIDEADIHYLGVAKILKKVNNDIEKIIPLMEFIEKKEIISYLRKKEVKKGQINYSFVNYQGVNIALMYIEVNFEGHDAIIGIIGSLRVDYKNNIKILNKILEKGNL